MMILSSIASAAEHRAEREISEALDRVLGRGRRRDVFELVCAETGRPASARSALYWMRVNMPTAAGLIDESR